MDPRELAELIVDDILNDLSDRSGVGSELEGMDREIYDELEGDLTDLVEKRLSENV